jgi:Uma2 family endonuclease
MATIPRTTREVDYPTSDGKPMAETDVHWQVMVDTVETLRDRYAAEMNVYVSGNLLLYYEEGNPRKHISPDAFVVRGVPKEPPRDYYLLWKEGKPPDVAVEITSKTTRREDQGKKLVIYRDILRVQEYFQFDPTQDYLKPPLQGYRLEGGLYLPIVPVDGRLPSEMLGLHLERDGRELRLYDPTSGLRLLTPREQRDAERRQAEEARRRAEEERTRAEEERTRAEEERTRAEEERTRAEEEKQGRLLAEAEVARLLAEVEALRRKAGESG